MNYVCVVFYSGAVTSFLPSGGLGLLLTAMPN